MHVSVSTHNNVFGLAVGSADVMMSMALPTAAEAIGRLDEIRSAWGIDRLCLPNTADRAGISSWAAAAGVPVEAVDVDTVARKFCGTADATADTIVAEAEARGFDVTDAEAQAIAVFDFVLGGPDVTRAGNFQ